MGKARRQRLTVKVVVVLELVPEERAGAVDLLASDNGDFLAREDLLGRESVIGGMLIPGDEEGVVDTEGYG